MSKIILIDSSYPINTRNSRIIKTLSRYYDTKYITWNRTNLKTSDKSNWIYSKTSGYGNKLSKLYNSIFYFKFVKKNLKNQKPDIVIASHWDMLIIAVILKKKLKFKLVYENLDMPDSKNKLVNIIIRSMEKRAIQRTNGIILASRFFAAQYNKNINSLIYENYPYNLKELYNNISVKHEDKVKIAFVGNVRHFITLKNLISAFQNHHVIEIVFYGTGIQEKSLKEYCSLNAITNVKFYGKYDYEEIPAIYSEIDLVWAAYPTDSFNVKSAISNKFFESIHFEKIGVFSENTCIGQLISENKIGITVDPYNIENVRESIEKFIGNSKNREMQENIINYKLLNELSWESNEPRLINFIQEIH